MKTSKRIIRLIERAVEAYEARTAVLADRLTFERYGVVTGGVKPSREPTPPPVDAPADAKAQVRFGRLPTPPAADPGRKTSAPYRTPEQAIADGWRREWNGWTRYPDDEAQPRYRRLEDIPPNWRETEAVPISVGAEA